MKEEIFIEIFLVDGARKKYREPSEQEIILLQEIFPGSTLKFGGRAARILERLSRQARANVDRRYPQDF